MTAPPLACGLALIAAAAAGCTAPIQLAVKDRASRRPTIVWVAKAPRPRLPAADHPVARDLQRVSFDLLVFDGADGQVVYRRHEMDGTSHRLETALQPGRTYYTTVRARLHLAGGAVRVGPWVVRRPFNSRYGRHPPPPQAMLQFRIPRPASDLR